VSLQNEQVQLSPTNFPCHDRTSIAASSPANATGAIDDAYASARRPIGSRRLRPRHGYRTRRSPSERNYAAVIAW